MMERVKSEKIQTEGQILLVILLFKRLVKATLQDLKILNRSTSDWNFQNSYQNKSQHSSILIFLFSI